MIYPIIHRNGTTKEDLVEQWNEAHWVLTQAVLKLQEAAPNARDYYPQGPEAIHTALAEHTARLQKLRSVLTDIEALREHVMFPIA